LGHLESCLEDIPITIFIRLIDSPAVLSFQEA
jgi:hypothetical protein